MNKKIINKIEEYKKIIIHVHQNADGDCTGSAFGLRDIINQSYKNKEVYIVGEEAQYLKFLGEFDTISDDVYNGALVIVLDTPIQKRISDQRYNLGEYLIKIDHHEFIEEFCNVELIKTDIPATAQIIMELFLENKDKLSISTYGLECLYTGILTDTGGFKFRGVSHKTFDCISEMLKLGLDFERVNNELSKTSESLIRFKGNLLLNYKKSDSGFVYFLVTDDMLKEFSIIREEAVGLVNELSRFEGCPVWSILYKNSETNCYRVRLRSKGPVINQFAKKYDGGGHPLASGATLKSEEEFNQFFVDVDELINNWKKDNK